MFAELKQYKTEHGHCNVPQKSGKLEAWVNHTRTHQKKGGLSEEQKELLDSIGSIWRDVVGVCVGRAIVERLERVFAKLEQYKIEHGYCNVPTESGALGSLVDNNRRSRNKLPEERRELLDRIGFRGLCGLVKESSITIGCDLQIIRI